MCGGVRIADEGEITCKVKGVPIAARFVGFADCDCIACMACMANEAVTAGFMVAVSALSSVAGV